MATVTLPRQRSSHGWGNAYSPETQSCEPVAWGVSSKPFRYEPITKRLGEPTVSQTFRVGGPRSVTISSSDSLMPKPRPHTQIRAPVTRVYSAFSHVLWLRKSMAPHRVCVTAFLSCSGDGAPSRGHVCQQNHRSCRSGFRSRPSLANARVVELCPALPHFTVYIIQ